MKSCLSTIGRIAVFAFFGVQPALADCQLIHATHSARSQAKAVETSQALALRSAYDLQRARGWRHITMSAHPVQGEPFCRSSQRGSRGRALRWHGSLYRRRRQGHRAVLIRFL